MKAKTVGKFVLGFLLWGAILSIINSFLGNGIFMFMAVGLCGAWLWNSYEEIV